MLPSNPDHDPKKPSPTRIGIWIVVAGVGAYFLITGVAGILNGG